MNTTTAWDLFMLSAYDDSDSLSHFLKVVFRIPGTVSSCDVSHIMIIYLKFHARLTFKCKIAVTCFCVGYSRYSTAVPVSGSGSGSGKVNFVNAPHIISHL